MKLMIEEPKIIVREATQRGYAVANEGDSINMAHPKSETRRDRVGRGVAQTLVTSEEQAVVTKSRIRKLTPRECWRLMGFTDEDYDKASAAVSASQLYKQAGNSIVKQVLMAIIGNMKPD